MTNCPQVAHSFANKFCQCEVEHTIIEGAQGGVKMSTHCAIYPQPLCEAVAQAVYDAATRVGWRA